MDSTSVSVGTRWKRILMVMAVMLTTLGGVLGFSQIASAHANTVSGVASCKAWDGTFSVTWTIVNDYNATETASYATSDQTDYSDPVPFANSVPVAKFGNKQVTTNGHKAAVKMKVYGVWSDNATNDATSALVAVPASCPKGTPLVSATAVCVSNDGEVSVTVSSTTTGAPIDFSVTVGGVTKTADDVAKGSPVTLKFTGVVDGVGSGSYKADGGSAVTFPIAPTVACDKGTPSVSATSKCVSNDGEVAVVLSNSGPSNIAFSVTVGGVTKTASVAKNVPQTLTFTGVVDGVGSGSYTADGGSAVTFPIAPTVACDKGTPSVSATSKCVSNDGEVAVVLSNSGPSNIAFSVTVGGVTKTASVAKNVPQTLTFTGVVDGVGSGSYTADGGSAVTFPIAPTVACDKGTPSVSATSKCVSNDGEVAVVLSNSGPSNIAFSVTVGGVTKTASVAKNVPQTLTFTGVVDGVGSGSYTADGGSAVTFPIAPTVACDKGTPSVSATSKCVSNDGEVAVVLSNSGPSNIAFSVTVGGVTKTASVAKNVPQTLTFTGVVDGVGSGSYTADGGSAVTFPIAPTVACDKGAPSVSATSKCVSNDGEVAVVLSNSGPSNIAFSVTVGGVTKTASVAKNVPQTLTFTGVVDGVGSGSYTADGGSAVTFPIAPTVACDKGTPSVSATVVCSSFDGTVSVKLSNTAGATTIAFSVTVGGVTKTANVAKGASTTVDFAGVADGVGSGSYTADGGSATPFSFSTVACDEGVPSVSSSVVCANGDGDVTVTLANTSGATAVVFTVTNPANAGDVRTVTINPGDPAATVVFAAVADGDAVVVPVTANGVATNQILAIDCDIPPVDVCANIDGVQTTVPAGTVQNGSDCVPPPPTDVCANIDGIQTQVPAGTVQNGTDCVPVESSPPTDVCANIDGIQAQVPSGMVLDGSNCVLVESNGPIAPAPEVMPEQLPIVPGALLPETGTSSMLGVLIGIGMVLAGGGAILVSRKRYSQSR